MDENNKYFKVIDPNNDIKNDVVIMIKPEDVNKTIERFKNAGYILEETECPKDAMMVSMPIERPKMPIDYDPFVDSKYEHYNGPCCGRCANRFKKTDFCTNHCQSNNCYRFKLEKQL